MARLFEVTASMLLPYMDMLADAGMICMCAQSKLVWSASQSGRLGLGGDCSVTVRVPVKHVWLAACLLADDPSPAKFSVQSSLFAGLSVTFDRGGASEDEVELIIVAVVHFLYTPVCMIVHSVMCESAL